MPKEVTNIKEFLTVAGRKDAREVRIKKLPPKGPNGKTRTKLKVRCARYLHTITIDDPEKAEKLRQSLPPVLKTIEIDKPKKK
ncbi:60S ribosomal protein L38 [Leucoagaricus gongylophorus]